MASDNKVDDSKISLIWIVLDNTYYLLRNWLNHPKEIPRDAVFIIIFSKHEVEVYATLGKAIEKCLSANINSENQAFVHIKVPQ